jgi:hypothetical protein
LQASRSVRPKGAPTSKKGDNFFPTVLVEDLFGAKMAPFPRTLRDSRSGRRPAGGAARWGRGKCIERQRNPKDSPEISRLGSARLGSARLGPARLGPARPGPARLGSARLGSARIGSARLGSGFPDSLSSLVFATFHVPLSNIFFDLCMFPFLTVKSNGSCFPIPRFPGSRSPLPRFPDFCNISCSPLSDFPIYRSPDSHSPIPRFPNFCNISRSSVLDLLWPHEVEFQLLGN